MKTYYSAMSLALIALLAPCCLHAGDKERVRPPGSRRVSNWPQWRGPARDDVSPESGLAKKWPEGGPGMVKTHEEPEKSVSRGGVAA